MTDRFDEAKRLHAAATPGALTVRDALGNDGQFDCALVDDAGKVVAECFGRVASDLTKGLRPAGANARNLVALHNLAPDLFALAEAAEWVVKAFEPIDDDTMSFLHDLKSAVDRVRGR